MNKVVFHRPTKDLRQRIVADCATVTMILLPLTRRYGNCCRTSSYDSSCSERLILVKGLIKTKPQELTLKAERAI
ncbi:hypothetical protein CEXT_64961 [Caerostris extrusa]|uniref:Uncharacterized protein n=1 Tax=Caerostris extrusa TaxID=172846 RepID=A0AAV4VK95_CAEEX|nr:hypothetical protein CEXT_64961 [Caerostris extrusa]